MTLYIWPITSYFLICFCNGVWSNKLYPPESYVKEMRPPVPPGEPVIVLIGIYILDITSINIENMDFRLDMFIRQTWNDSRLKLPEDRFEEGDEHINLPPEFYSNIWQPDTYFVNSKFTEIANFNHKFITVKLYKNQTVTYSARMHATIACRMKFKPYPVDVHSCPVNIESFSYNSRKLLFRWSESGVTIAPKLQLLQYNIGQPLHLEKNQTYLYDKDGNYSRLITYVRFERQIGNHLIQTFVPSSLVVILSWFNFWLGLEIIPTRITLVVTSMLTIVTMFTGLRTIMPAVAYVKALDVWMAGCMLFIFAALGEVIIVYVLSKKNMMNKAKKQPSTTDINPEVAGIDAETGQDNPLICRKLDIISRIVFPALFLIFAGMYSPLIIHKPLS